MVTVNGEEYYTMSEACTILGVKPATLYAYVSRGRVQSYRQGMRRQRLYRRSEIDLLAHVTPSQESHVPLIDAWLDIH